MNKNIARTILSAAGILVTIAVVVGAVGFLLSTTSGLTPPPESTPPRAPYVDAFNPCDDELKRQLVSDQLADSAYDFNEIVGHILLNRPDCLDRHWSPTAVDAQRHGMCGERALLRPDAVGGQRPPQSLLYGTGPTVPTPFQITPYSYRDRDNNIPVHWMRQHRPDDKANCWLYLSRQERWHSE